MTHYLKANSNKWITCLIGQPIRVFFKKKNCKKNDFIIIRVIHGLSGLTILLNGLTWVELNYPNPIIPHPNLLILYWVCGSCRKITTLNMSNEWNNSAQGSKALASLQPSFPTHLETPREMKKKEKIKELWSWRKNPRLQG